MSNQMTTPPDNMELKTQQPQDEPQLWRNIGQREAFWSSLFANLREAFFPVKRAPLQLQSKPIPVADPFAEESLWISVRNDFRDLFFPAKLPPLVLESHEIAVRDPLAPTRDRQSSMISGVVHAVLLAMIIAFSIWHPKHPEVVKVLQKADFDISPFTPETPKGMQAMGGGGGGGDRDILQAAKGKLPKIDKVQITPPDEIIRNDHPKLAVAPTVVIPPDIKIPNNNMPNLGDPMTTVKGPASNGNGAAGGIGSGKSGGIGSGTGAGMGPGQGGGYGGGVMRVGNGVTPPVAVYTVDPDFSPEARRAHYSGTVAVQIVVDANGLPKDPRVVRPLGMGLDEKALEAVKQYRFKPAMYQGRPVPVAMVVDVDFNIFGS